MFVCGETVRRVCGYENLYVYESGQRKSVHMRVCVREGEREREKRVFVCKRERKKKECMCVRESEREKKRVFVCKRE